MSFDTTHFRAMVAECIQKYGIDIQSLQALAGLLGTLSLAPHTIFYIQSLTTEHADGPIPESVIDEIADALVATKETTSFVAATSSSFRCTTTAAAATA